MIGFHSLSNFGLVMEGSNPAPRIRLVSSPHGRDPAAVVNPRRLALERLPLAFVASEPKAESVALGEILDPGIRRAEVPEQRPSFLLSEGGDRDNREVGK